MLKIWATFIATFLRLTLPILTKMATTTPFGGRVSLFCNSSFQELGHSNRILLPPIAPPIKHFKLYILTTQQSRRNIEVNTINFKLITSMCNYFLLTFKASIFAFDWLYPPAQTITPSFGSFVKSIFNHGPRQCHIF